jgi:hypothetical protein
LTSWEAATELVRTWEAQGSFEALNPDAEIQDAAAKFIADAEVRNLA